MFAHEIGRDLDRASGAYDGGPEVLDKRPLVSSSDGMLKMLQCFESLRRGTKAEADNLAFD